MAWSSCWLRLSRSRRKKSGRRSRSARSKCCSTCKTRRRPSPFLTKCTAREPSSPSSSTSPQASSSTRTFTGSSMWSKSISLLTASFKCSSRTPLTSRCLRKASRGVILRSRCNAPLCSIRLDRTRTRCLYQKLSIRSMREPTLEKSRKRSRRKSGLKRRKRKSSQSRERRRRRQQRQRHRRHRHGDYCRHLAGS